MCLADRSPNYLALAELGEPEVVRRALGGRGAFLR